MDREIETIIQSDRPEVERIAAAFQVVVERYVGHAENEMELARAMGDEESAVKARIKAGVMSYSASVFSDLYQMVTGRKAWDEQ